MAMERTSSLMVIVFYAKSIQYHLIFPQHVMITAFIMYNLLVKLGRCYDLDATIFNHNITKLQTSQGQWTCFLTNSHLFHEIITSTHKGYIRGNGTEMERYRFNIKMAEER